MRRPSDSACACSARRSCRPSSPESSAIPEHPELWALRLTLREVGIELDETLLFGLAGGAGLVADPAAEPGTPAWLSGWDPAQSSLQTAAAHLGVMRAQQQTPRAARAAEALDLLLEDGCAAVLWLDRSKLAGDSVPAGVRLPAGPGVAVVSGGTGERVSVHPAAGVGLLVTREQLAEARAAVPDQRHRLLAVQAGELDLPRAVRGGLAMVAVGGTRGKKRQHGDSALAGLAARSGGTGRGDWPRRYPGEQLPAALLALADRIDAEDGLWRGAQAAYELRAAELLKLAALEHVAAAHTQLAAGWREAAHLARTLASQGGRLAALAAQLQALAEAERAALEQLRATLRAH